MTVLYDLDQLYGIVLLPQGDGVRQWERSAPIEHSRLDGQFANDMITMRQQAEAMAALRPVLLSLTYIWAVDQAGHIFIAPQLAFDIKDPTKIFPLPRGLPKVSTLRLFGHPTLVGGDGARIAGEMYLDLDDNRSLTWVIDNQSGRYGRHWSRTESHLLNVKQCFAALGVEVATDFI